MLANGGSKAAASKDRLDFSTAQLQGTCGASPWWAWLRHEIIEAGTERSDRRAAYAEWRVLKNEIKRAIVNKIGKDSLQEKIFKAANDKIEKHSQLSKLMTIANDRAQFNETKGNLQNTLLKFLTREEIISTFGNLNKDFLDYENSGTRWHLLSNVSKMIAGEILKLDAKKRSEFLKGHKLERLTHLTLLDLETTEKQLQKLLLDCEKNKKWKTIGATLGRLALDPKLAPVALRLGKQWLMLSPEAKARVVDEDEQKAAEKAIQENFLYYVSRGKGQEKPIRDFAIHFRSNGQKTLAEKFWRVHRTYVGSEFGELIATDCLEIPDLELIANTVSDIQDTLTVILALRNTYSSRAMQKIFTQLIDKALKLDDQKYTNLKKAVESLYAAHFDNLAEMIRKKVAARLAS